MIFGTTLCVCLKESQLKEEKNMKSPTLSVRFSEVSVKKELKYFFD